MSALGVEMTVQPDRTQARESQVKSMFDRIADHYDLMNSV
ncbi:hypothetical protein LCGC14_2715860, partial [marine sediment metagenome]